MKKSGPAEKTQPVDARMKLKRLNAKEPHSLNSPCQVLQTPDANSTASQQYARSLGEILSTGRSFAIHRAHIRFPIQNMAVH